MPHAAPGSGVGNDSSHPVLPGTDAAGKSKREPDSIEPLSCQEARSTGEVSGNCIKRDLGREADRFAVLAAREIKLADVPQQLSETGVLPDRVQNLFVARHAADDSSGR